MFLHPSRSELRAKNMKFTGQWGREVSAKLGELVEEVEHGGAKSAFGAVESDVDNLMPQVFSEVLNQIQNLADKGVKISGKSIRRPVRVE